MFVIPAKVVFLSGFNLKYLFISQGLYGIFIGGLDGGPQSKNNAYGDRDTGGNNDIKGCDYLCKLGLGYDNVAC